MHHPYVRNVIFPKLQIYQRIEIGLGIRILLEISCKSSPYLGCLCVHLSHGHHGLHQSHLVPPMVLTSVSYWMAHQPFKPNVMRSVKVL